MFLKLSCFCFSQTEVDLTKLFSFEWEEEEKRDWSFLKEVLKDKKIVGLGESLHGVKEYSEVKLELIKYLHEEMGFNVLAMESEMGSTILSGWYRELFSNTLLLEKAFYPVWHTKTNLKLVNYLKQHPKLKIIGFDTPYYFSIDTFLHQEITATVSRNEIEKRTDFKKLTAYFTDLKQKYTEKELLKKRDSLMAKNFNWLISNFHQNEKVIIWAANDHLSKVRLNEFSFMGEILAKEHGNEFYALGLFHSLGNPTHFYRDYFYENKYELLSESSLEFKFLKLKADNLFIDFENLKRTKKTAWLNESVNQIIDIKRPMATINLSQSFDGLIWFKEVTHPSYVIEKEELYLKN